MSNQHILIEQGTLEDLKKKDESLRKLIEYVGDVHREYNPDAFVSLVNNIIYQQLAYKAAFTIYSRFEQLVGEVTPKKVQETSVESMRACGISSAKVQTIQNVADAFLNQSLSSLPFQELTDEEIIQKLTQIKGIGRWTAEMFLIFSLNRQNVLSQTDLALKKGLKWLYQLKNDPTTAQLETYKRRFSPYNSLVSLYLWEITIQNLFKYPSVDALILDHFVGYMTSPLGDIELQANQEAIISVDFCSHRRYAEKLNPIIIKTKQQLEEYFNGERTDFTIPLHTDGTSFQTQVWEALQSIPFGETRSYKDIAMTILNEKAVRAVGGANNKNKISILIPCHRVIGHQGKMVGYAGGLWRKEWLLNHEKQLKNTLKKR